MDTFNLLAIISAFLIGAVFFIVNIQKKEQKKAAQFHETSKYKYRANEAANVLSNFSKIPIGEETRRILLQVIKRNLELAINIQPNDSYVKSRLPTVDQELANVVNQVDKAQLRIPAEAQQLERLLNSLKKLSLYVIKISKTNKLDSSLTTTALTKISSLITEAKICAYIQQIEKGVSLKKYNFAVKGLVTTKQIIAGLKIKNERILALNDRLMNLEQIVKSCVQKAKKAELNQPKKQQVASSSQLSEESKSIFGEKKKW